uniref:U1-type domain-containing protein n=1 Tax=Strigamia maritima TaxID=126957 RepID=T1JIL1_STRMM
MTTSQLALEASSTTLLTRAVELDTNKRYTEALACYQEGLNQLLTVIKNLKDAGKQSKFRTKATEYMERAEKLKCHIEQEKQTGKYHEELFIEENSVNHGYEKVFGRFLDEFVVVVEIEDPYIRNIHQICNFVRCCELLVKRCKRLEEIHLITTENTNSSDGAKLHLEKLTASLLARNIKLDISYSTSLHDREIRLDNGWVIKIGRGLDYFKSAEKFSLGYFDFDLRPCLETTVNVFHRKFTKTLRHNLMDSFVHLLLLKRPTPTDVVSIPFIKISSANMASTSGNIEDHRRKWDRDEYERLANERIQAEFDAIEAGKSGLPAIKREFLKQRDYKVDLESKLGKSLVITKTTPQSQSGGYYCNVCDCVVKDSINFLDHINGKKHQRNLGMSMRIERSSLDQVKKRFEVIKKKQEEKSAEYNFDQRMQELREEEEKVKEYRREKRKERKRKAAEALEEFNDVDPEMAAVMGFEGFGSAKR